MMVSVDELKSKLPMNVVEDVEKSLPKGISADKVKKIYEGVTEEYENAKVSPGESVGIISAESIGEPGTQMCIAYDERVIVKQDDAIQIVKAGEFVDSVLDSGQYPVGKAKGYEFTDIKGVSVLSLNENEKLEWKDVSKVNRVKSPEKLLKITTKSGRKITATDYHSFVTRKNNKVVSVAGKDLKVGNRIPSVKYLPEHCTEAINVYEYVDMPVADGRITREYRPTKLLPSELKLDWNFGWFIGAYLAEGSAPLGQLSISNLDDNYMSNAKKFIDSIGLDFAEKRHHRGFSDSRDLIINSSLLARFTRNICGNGSANKKVPQFAYSAKEDFVSGLLRGYFDGDGNISVNRKMIRASSNSEELLDGIKLLLTRFGIFAFKSKDHKQHYLIIPYKYAPLYLEKIGSDIDYKKNNLMKLKKLAEDNVANSYQDYTDMISGFDSVLVDASGKLGLPTRNVNSATKRQKIGRTALQRYVSEFEKMSREKNIDISPELIILRTMLNSDVVWDEIERIEQVKPQHEYVYDLTVPELHTFTTFDGLVIHNTLNTFHFAGVSEMNVTMGLPRLIEILDGRKTIETPTMEIYLLEPFKSGKNIKELAIRIKETRLGEIVKEFVIDLAENAVSFSIDEEKARMVGATPSSVIKAVEKGTKLHVKNEGKEYIVPVTSKEAGVNEVYKLKELLRSVFVAGIKGITQVLPVKRGDEYVIITAGTNLKAIMDFEGIDKTRTTSNDIFEMQDVLGIEATRATIINEIYKVIESQGLNVDERHIMLVADMMTVDGLIKGITRYGVIGEKSSVLARASFETPIKHIINAALVGEVDPLNSVVENVMINQVIPIGTGLPRVVMRREK
jgi:DNA-directed RNA polymerase subunit A"